MMLFGLLDALWFQMMKKKEASLMRMSINIMEDGTAFFQNRV